MKPVLFHSKNKETLRVSSKLHGKFHFPLKTFFKAWTINPNTLQKPQFFLLSSRHNKDTRNGSWNWSASSSLSAISQVMHEGRGRKTLSKSMLLATKVPINCRSDQYLFLVHVCAPKPMRHTLCPLYCLQWSHHWKESVPQKYMYVVCVFL